MSERPPKGRADTHLSLLLVEIVNDDADEEVEREEGAKNDEDHEVQVHVEVDFSNWLFLHLKQGDRWLPWRLPGLGPPDSHTYSSRINGCVHYFHPPFKCRLSTPDNIVIHRKRSQ